MLELVELGDRAKERPSRLSGGQRQRVALARALINEPKVLLLDEPLAALDLKLRHAMQAELKSIQREVGITFLFVTHDQDEALSMSDRVAIMNDGVIEQCGTPEDVYEHPTSVFAAGFIGTSNLMSGTWSRRPRRRRPGRLGSRHRSTAARPRATPSASRSGRRRSGSATSRPRCSACPAPSWRPSTTAPPPSTSSRSRPTSPSPSSSRTSRGCGPRTGGTPGDRVEMGWLPGAHGGAAVTRSPRTSWSWAPAWPAWPPRATSRRAGRRSRCSRPGPGSAGGSSRSSSPTAASSSSVARWSATPTPATSAWSRSSG